MVGQTYRKNSHAGLAYQLITFPNLVNVKATNVQKDADITHEITIDPTHIATCFAYTDLLTSVPEIIHNYLDLLKKINTDRVRDRT